MSKAKIHPLLAAVIAQLPASGAEFPAHARVAWLKMMGQAFDMAYGPDAAVVVRLASDDVAFGGAAAGGMADASAPVLQIPLRPQPAAPAAKPERRPHVAAGCDFYVDEQGVARCDHSSAIEGERAVPTPARRVTADEASGHDIYDYRGARRDRQTVVWADDQVGAQPGMVFCGPG